MEIINFIKKLQSFVNSTPNKVMFVDEKATRRTTYAEFWTLVQKIAYLINQRLQGKERFFVPIYLADSMEYFASEIAIWMTGNAAVHMGLSFPQERVDYIMHHCEAEFMIDGKFIEEARQLNEKYTNIRPRTSDQPCSMYYTSGSTGNPKGVLHSDAASMFPIAGLAKTIPLNDYAKFATPTPCYFAAMVITYSMMLAGSELHLLAPEIRRDVHLLEDYIAAQQIELAIISPSLLRIYKNRAKSLKAVIATGERLVGCYSEEYTVLNTFGQTEVAGPVFIKPLDKNYDNTPIGKPIPGVEVMIINEDGQEVPDGEVGELCYTSGIKPPVYYKDPERTAALVAGGVMHSGDLMKRLPNGDILYVQRKDWMVKINGQRVEPGEVESVMRHIQGVKDAIVKGFTTEDLTRQYLVGYYILESGSALDADCIKTELEKKLPSYMVPQYMVEMEAFPLNANNKIDRKSLLPPDLTSMQSEYVAPTNEVEKALCDAFAKVLKLERVGVNDSFAQLGGDSIRLMELLQTMQYDIPANIVLSKGTPRKIAEFIDESLSTEGEFQTMVDYPLTTAPLYFLQMALAAPNSSAGNIPFIHRLPLSIDVERLKNAVESAVNAHPSMKIRIVTNEQGEYRMQPSAERWHLDIEEMSDKEFEELRPNIIRCFRYLEEMLFEIRLIKTESAVYLSCNIHHIITDGTSDSILVTEISQAYSGMQIPCEEQTVFEFNAEMERARHSAVFEECKEWFAREFEGSYPGNDMKVEGEMKTYQKQLAIPSHQQMDTLCRKYGVTLNALFMATLAQAIDKDVNRRDVRIGTSFHGRMSQKSQRTFGFIATPRIYRFHWNEQDSMADYLTRSKEHILGNMARTMLSVNELIQMINLPLDAPLFIYQGQLGSNTLMLDGIESETQKLPRDTPRTSPLCTFIYDKGVTDFTFEVWYDSSKYTHKYVEALTENLESIINKL